MSATHRHPPIEGTALVPHLSEGDDVREQIRMLQALTDLRDARMLTDTELADIKRRVLASGAMMPRATRLEATYVTALEVVGTLPITYNVGGNRRPSYRSWIEVLDAAASEAAARARPVDSRSFSVRIELRLYMPNRQASDLDNYVKPIQDALARHGVFGHTAYKGSTMRGDERVDHLDLRRRRVACPEEAGVLAEVLALDTYS